MDNTTCPKNWWEYHHAKCGIDYRGCHPTLCPKDQYEKTGVWRNPVESTPVTDLSQPTLTQQETTVSRNLFQVQDPDRTMFVIATTFEEALEKWRAKVRLESIENPCPEPINPEGVIYAWPTPTTLSSNPLPKIAYPNGGAP